MPPTFKQRLASYLLKDDVRKLRAKATILDRMNREGMAWQPWLSANPSVLRELLMDTETLDFLTMQLQWQSLSGDATGDDNESARQQIVNLSRYYYHNDPTTWHSIRIITDFSVGRTIKVVCEDEDAQPVWDAFWTNPANRVWLSSGGLKKASDIWLVDGEFIPVYFSSKVDGEVRVRRFPTDQITELVCDPDDADSVVLYKRCWTEPVKGAQTLYYRDWRASDKDVQNALKALGNTNNIVVAGDRNTDIAVMLGAVNTISNRGWPWASRSMAWAEIYSQFLKDRAAVASSVALWVREMKVKAGGSKGVDAVRDLIRSTLSYSDTETNPAPAAGSTLITNPAVDVSEKPMTTGAGDASRDSLMFATVASNGAGLAPFYNGHAESTANYATAQVIAQPMYEMFAGYSETWRSLVQDMVDHVLTIWEQYGRNNGGIKANKEFESHEATVTLGVTPAVPFEVMMGAIGTLGQLQAVPVKALADIALKLPAFGIEDPDAWLKQFEQAAEPTGEPVNVVGVPGSPPAKEQPEATAQGTGQGAEPVKQGEEEEEPTSESDDEGNGYHDLLPTRAESVALLEAAARVLAMEGDDAN